jgi:hypothetical protein
MTPICYAIEHCEDYRTRKEISGGDRKLLAVIKAEEHLHRSMVRYERQQYATRIFQANSQSNRYLSINMDAADQAAYAYPVGTVIAL